ncbi:MAG TPA: hypothetical protein VHT70_02200 [Candidatus Saccharimonadales bacterium]|jgi:hypothetical protein|nr:hypothetical protein [Candidatus Saccharimonadales bacterium]
MKRETMNIIGGSVDCTVGAFACYVVGGAALTVGLYRPGPEE